MTFAEIKTWLTENWPAIEAFLAKLYAFIKEA